MLLAYQIDFVSKEERGRNMYYELYIDVLFLVNFMMDYLLLLTVSRILTCTATHVSIFTGALMGAISTCAVICIPGHHFLMKFILFHIVINTVMIRAGLKIKERKKFLQAYLLLYICTFFLGGVMQFLGGHVKTAGLFVLIAAVSYEVMQGAFWLLAQLRSIQNYRCKVTVYLNGISHTVEALIDTCLLYTSIVIPVLISFVLSVLMGPVVIPFLRRLKMGQTERVEGVQSHLKKAGTPTMGGVMILISVLVTSLFYVKDYPKIIPVLFVTVGFGLIGFLDDYLKVVMKRSDGLFPMQKMALQIVVTAVFAFYLVKFTDVSLTMLIPFSGGKYLDIGWLAIPLLFIAVIGTVNGVNFTDGLDGLASSVTVLVAIFFTVIAVGTKSGLEPVTCAVVGALLGFLLFNVYPAKVFMGDTGSLALGGFVASTAYMLRMPIFILIVGMIYFVEVLSVMIQVTYFKKTGGKRFFKMAPIHHHFELCGWSETRVVAVFSIITAILCLIALLAL